MRRGLNRTVLAGRIVVLVACGLGGAGLAAEEVRFVGKWESVTQSRGGIGSTLEFHSDGTMSLTPGAMVDFTYLLDGARLVISFTDPGTGEVSESSLNVHISGESMIQSDPKTGEEIQYVRLDTAKEGGCPAHRWYLVL